MNCPSSPKIGYLIPEFPGQTHVWIWREIVHMREWGVNIRIYSTRQPSDRDRARHSFAGSASAETTYLWPSSIFSLFVGVIWAISTRPIRFLRCVWLAFTLPVQDQPGRRRRVLPLIPVATVLALNMKRTHVGHLHCHTCASGAVIAMLAKELTDIPYSMTLNANLEWWGGAMGEKFAHAAFTIAITEWLLAQIRREFPELGSDQMLLGRIGVDTQKWIPAKTKGAAPVFQIATVGRLHESKGHDILFEERLHK